MTDPGEQPAFQRPLTDERAGQASTDPLARELDHRLANSLQLAANFLIFEQARLRDPQALDALSQAAARLAAVAQLHRFLSANGPSARVQLAPFLIQLSGFIAGSTGLDCSVDADPVAVSGATAQQLAIAVNELAINAAKHAYLPGKPGALTITARVQDRRLRLTVADQGRGLGPTKGLPTKGLGMTIVRAIVRQLGATLYVTENGGAVFTIEAPLSPPAGMSRSFAPR